MSDASLKALRAEEAQVTAEIAGLEEALESKRARLDAIRRAIAILNANADSGRSLSTSLRIVETLSQHPGLSVEEIADRVYGSRSDAGKLRVFLSVLKKRAKWVDNPERGRWKVTARGIKALKDESEK